MVCTVFIGFVNFDFYFLFCIKTSGFYFSEKVFFWRF